MREYNVFNVLDLIESIGEEQVVQLLSDFSCPQNFEVESFLQNKAIQFAKQKISVSFLVFDSEIRLVGYFTLVHKMASVQVKALKSKEQRKGKDSQKRRRKYKIYTVIEIFLIVEGGILLVGR